MSKKKIIAIILFIFLCLFMFTYAGPGNLELKDIKDSKEPIEDQNKDNNNDKDNKDNIKDDSKENIKVVVKNAPEIIVEPYKVVILYGDDYDIMSGVSLNGEEKLSIKADITSTKELKVGQHIVTYTAEDKNGNKATATRKIIVLDPQGDEDKDGFTNEEEIKNDDPKDPFDPESHPETIAPTIKLLGSNPYRMAVNTKYLEEFVEITLDPHDLITTLDDVKVEGKVDNKTIGEYVITYTIVDRYKKSASVSRTVKVLEDKNNNGIIDEDENHYTIDFECEGRGHLNGTLTYSDILVDLTFDEAQIIIPEAVADTYYELKRWEPLTPNGNTKVIGNATYKAVFGPINDLNNNGIADEEEAHYTVKFEAGLNGSLTGTTVYENILTGLTLEEAGVVSPTVAPNKDYKFEKFSPSFNLKDKVTSDITYVATYFKDLNDNNIPDEKEAHYSVKFISEGNGHLEGKLEYLEVLTGLTLKEANIVIPKVVANTYYELKRWEPVVPTNDTVVSSNITYKAIFGPINDKNNNGIADEEETYKLEIEYVYVNGTKAAETKVEDVVYNMPYSVTSPIIEKYTADRLVVEGTMPNEDLKVTVTYKATNDLNNNDIPDEEEDHYTVKFEAGLNGSLNGTTVYENILTGLTLKEANVVSPTVIPNAGYKFDGWEPEVLDNTKVTSNLTYTAKYVVDDSTVLTGIILKENPNAQLMFQKNTNINIKDYVYVLKVYKDNHTVVANKDEYVINGFSTSKVGTYQITATLNNLLSNSLNYKIVEESAYPTKFEVKFNDTNKYRETKNSFCTGNCDSIQNTNEVVLDHNFIEITEHYDENIKISNIVVRYTNNTTKSINNKLVLSDSVRWSRVDGLNQYDPVYILESYSSKKEHLLLPTDYTYDNIMTSNIIIDTLDITYTKDNKYTYTITFKYDIASKTFKAIKEV